MDSKPRVFYIALNMAGAISAGAYTAGVMDFFIDALDTLYAERERQQAKYGNDYSKWEIPAHEVRVVALSGASAGGMTSAMAAASLCEDFTPVRAPMPASAPNRLYKSWVEDIDISYLLGSDDLTDSRAPVTSVLDCTQIDHIAAEAIQLRKPRPEKRPYVSDGLKVILTLTNLSGIPYGIDAASGADETQTLYHADQANFEVRWDGAQPKGEALLLSAFSPDNWPALRDAAKATGAFPVALAPRYLDRSTSFYNWRSWRISADNPEPAPQGCQCETYATLKPNWTYSDSVSFRTLNVDGGITNNNPFECAHQVLCEQDPVQAFHNPRSAGEADRAVISIAPFLSTPAFNLHPPADDLGSVLGSLLDTMVNQSRIQGENIKLTQDPNVFSRFAISPSIDDTTRDALASASLGAFGGFLAKEFRDHDYQLGRRNCQWFLKQHFVLPTDNVVMAGYALSPDVVQRFGTILPGGARAIPVIPLLGGLDPDVNPIPEVHVKIAQQRLLPIADAAAARLKLVIARLINRGGSRRLGTLWLNAGWLFAENVVKRELLKKIGFDLGRQNLIV
jgi:hypothetical protein